MSRERTLQLVVAYDGTRFAGWQRQGNARTVQETLEKALQQILGMRVRVFGAGRTDSGVHAEGQVAHVKTDSKRSPRIIHRALNAVLPEDVLVRSVRTVPSGFHARYSAKSKRYRYRIWNRPLRPLFDRTQVLHIPTPLHVRNMQRAAGLLRGRHDFRAFASTGQKVSSTVRTIRLLMVKQNRGTILIEAEADGFLYHMVRRIVGLLIEVGKGRVAPDSIPAILKGRRRIIPPTAAAKGLCLVKVMYT